MAGTHRATRPAGIPTTTASRASISSPTGNEHSAERPIFSATSPDLDTSPRTRRPKACSSRSTASIPAARIEHVNSRQTATAAAAPKPSSGVRLPPMIVRLTSTGLETVPSPALAIPRPSPASAAKRCTRASAARSGELAGSAAIAWARIGLAALRPSRSKSPIGVVIVPPSKMSDTSSIATSLSLSDSAWLALASWLSIVDSTRFCLSASPL